MGSDTAPSKDLGGRRKKATRSAKLKQCKLEARREQWISQQASSPSMAAVKKRSSKVGDAVISATKRDDQTAEGEESSPPVSELITQEADEESLDDWEAAADSQISPKFGEPVQSARNSAAEERTHRAWRSDDVFRPASLPNVGDRRISSDAALACPICYEDLDPTDSSFRPCGCGFRLCLFCHQKILEADARCPGCRKLYST